MAEIPPETVVVTGFGIFGEYKINASWEVAKELSKFNFEKELGIKLVIEEIPVAYESVAEKVPQLWKQYNPVLVIHMGVSWMASELTIETCAHKSGYYKSDTCGKFPGNGECCQGSCEKKQAGLDLQQVVEQVNKTSHDVKACLSCDAGRYLCEFIYYTSLCIDDTCTVFIHVPEINKPYSVAQMAEGVRKILTVILSQIRLHSSKLAVQNEL
ncbi:pyroglutamyl-peptidase 1 [Anabrus simplex]|uniref:pyroglutamyl-peptidase 1 n=1 Tax=Anabrus simplex TaxID=316456 RepID=UPI0034DD92DE